MIIGIVGTGSWSVCFIIYEVCTLLIALGRRYIHFPSSILIYMGMDSFQSKASSKRDCLRYSSELNSLDLSETENHFQSQSTIDGMVQACWSGPNFAAVRAVDETPSEEIPSGGFEIRR